MANREPAGATRTLRQECHEPDPDIARGESLNGHLREYFPGFLAVVGDRGLPPHHPRPHGRRPTPGPARLTRTQLRPLLKRAGRKNSIEAEVERLHQYPAEVTNTTAQQWHWQRRPYAGGFWTIG